MLNLLEQIKPFLEKRLPKIALIEIADIALMNLARANYGFTADEITTIIYVGAEFTRLIFMKGFGILSLRPGTRRRSRFTEHPEHSLQSTPARTG